MMTKNRYGLVESPESACVYEWLGVAGVSQVTNDYRHILDKDDEL